MVPLLHPKGGLTNLYLLLPGVNIYTGSPQKYSLPTELGWVGGKNNCPLLMSQTLPHLELWGQRRLFGYSPPIAKHRYNQKSSLIIDQHG